jgi:hypothetical protein
MIIEMPVLMLPPQQCHAMRVHYFETEQQGEDLEIVASAVNVVAKKKVRDVQDVTLFHWCLLPLEVREQI